jgi:dTDP-4-amino-4,6-dideoxygalactose transaminase
MKRTLYKTWTCPVAEDISKRILLLPNHVWISIKKAEKTIEIINNFKG